MIHTRWPFSWNEGQNFGMGRSAIVSRISLHMVLHGTFWFICSNINAHVRYSVRMLLFKSLRIFRCKFFLKILYMFLFHMIFLSLEMIFWNKLYILNLTPYTSPHWKSECLTFKIGRIEANVASYISLYEWHSHLVVDWWPSWNKMYFDVYLFSSCRDVVVLYHLLGHLWTKCNCFGPFGVMHAFLGLVLTWGWSSSKLICCHGGRN